MPEAKDSGKSNAPNSYPTWSPRFWHGMRSHVWWRTLLSNGLRISFSRMHIVLGVSFFTPLNDLLAFVQWCIYGRKIAKAELQAPPVFIIGHWRSGTTLLHELLVTDPQFACASTFQCFAPSHHLVSQWAFVKFGSFLLPDKRPMDNMKAGWELPQEDEFALMNLGVGSPYLRIAFPQTQPKRLEYLTLADVPAEPKRLWSDALQWFVRTLAVANPGKRLVMKSPTHTGRVALLAELFPGAKFVHLTRDPKKLVPSTVRLWDSLDAVQALQRPADDPAADHQYVDDCMQEMYKGFDQQVAGLPRSDFMQIRYEDLVKDPRGIVEQIYSQLGLDGFDVMLPHLEKRLEGHGEYRVNQHATNAEKEQAIMRRWAKYACDFGYE